MIKVAARRASGSLACAKTCPVVDAHVSQILCWPARVCEYAVSIMFMPISVCDDAEVGEIIGHRRDYMQDRLTPSNKPLVQLKSSYQASGPRSPIDIYLVLLQHEVVEAIDCR